MFAAILAFAAANPAPAPAPAPEPKPGAILAAPYSGYIAPITTYNSAYYPSYPYAAAYNTLPLYRSYYY